METEKKDYVELIKLLFKSEKYGWLIPVITLAVIAYFLKIDVTQMSSISYLFISQIIMIIVILFKKSQNIITCKAPAELEKQLNIIVSKLEKAAVALDNILPEAHREDILEDRLNQRTKILEQEFLLETVKTYNVLQPFSADNKIPTLQHKEIVKKLITSLQQDKIFYLSDLDKIFGEERPLDYTSRNKIKELIDEAIEEANKEFSDIEHNNKFYKMSMSFFDMSSNIIKLFQEKIKDYKRTPIVVN